MYHPKKKKVNPRSGYDRAGLLPLTYLVELEPKEEFKENKFRHINNRRVKITSQRYPVFQKSQKCCNCGIEASHLAIERSKGNKNNSTYHVNMYAVSNGNEVLMTKDHIIPKSKGGEDVYDNYQTMCTHCNSKKGNRLISNENTLNKS